MAPGIVERVDLGDHRAWFKGRIAQWDGARGVHRVDELLPSDYEEYLRLFHPIRPREGDGGQTWAGVAALAGAHFHAELTARTLDPVLKAHGLGIDSEGIIGQPVRQSLFRVLTSETRSQHAWFFYNVAGSVFLGNRALFRAPVTAVDHVIEHANAEAGRAVAGPEEVWPDDRSWIVHTDYDLVSTYIACSARTADRLKREPTLELIPVTRDTRVDDGADLLNGTGYERS